MTWAAPRCIRPVPTAAQASNSSVAPADAAADAGAFAAAAAAACEAASRPCEKAVVASSLGCLRTAAAAAAAGGGAGSSWSWRAR